MHIKVGVCRCYNSLRDVSLINDHKSQTCTHRILMLSRLKVSCHVLIATLIDTGWNMFQVNLVSHQPFKQSRNAMVLHWTVTWHCGCIEVGPWSHSGWDHFRKTICCWKRLGISTWVTLVTGIPTRDEEFRAMAQNSNSSSQPGLWLATRQQS